MVEEFCIAAFRSRQQVMAFAHALNQQGVPSSVMITPRAVAMGCGLSVRIETEHLHRAVQVYRQTNPGNPSLGNPSFGNLIGFYHVQQETNGRTQVHPAGIG